MSNVNHVIEYHLRHQPKQLLGLIKQDFQRNHIAVMNDLTSRELKKAMGEEALHLLSEESKRRELIIRQTGDTPRAYSSVGRDDIQHFNGIIPAFYHSESVLSFLADVADEELYPVPYAPEEYIINSQDRIGDTHGWHWDDYTYAFVWIVEAPDPLFGGRLEFIPRTTWDKSAPKSALRHILETREVHSRHLVAGSCYLLKANTTLHRIAPLSNASRRTVIVFTYASKADLSDESISHDTMESIYAPELEAA